VKGYPLEILRIYKPTLEYLPNGRQVAGNVAGHMFDDEKLNIQRGYRENCSAAPGPSIQFCKTMVISYEYWKTIF
jgi:hypothetical protein